MIDELLLFIEKHRGNSFERTTTRPQETLEIKMNRQKYRFSFSPSIDLGSQSDPPNGGSNRF